MRLTYCNIQVTIFCSEVIEMLDIKELRFKNDRMTQEQLSKQTGISRQTIVRLEKGQVPSVDTAKKLTKAFTSVKWFEFLA